MPDDSEYFMPVMAEESGVTTYEPMPGMLAGYGTTVAMAGEPMDDSRPAIDDLANDAYFPRYGAAVCYTGSSTRRTTK